jgi:hypothetical protein
VVGAAWIAEADLQTLRDLKRILGCPNFPAVGALVLGAAMPAYSALVVTPDGHILKVNSFLAPDTTTALERAGQVASRPAKESAPLRTC